MVKGPWGIPCQNNVREEGWKRVLLGDTTLEKRIMEKRPWGMPCKSNVTALE